MNNTKRIIIGITNNDNETLLLTRDGFTTMGKLVANFCKETYNINKWYYDKECSLTPYFGAYNNIEIPKEEWASKKDMVGNLGIEIYHEGDENYQKISTWLFQKKTRITK